MPNLPSVTQPRAILLAPDDKNSIHAELAGAQHNSIAYSPYGRQSAQQKIASHLGFNGELCERAIGWYFLGKGYRVYNPILMRFHSPDSWSPFGKGGLNAYRYCGGDPVNFTDPTGHMKLPRVFRTSRTSPSPPTLPRSTATPNVYLPLPARSSSTAQTLPTSGVSLPSLLPTEAIQPPAPSRFITLEQLGPVPPNTAPTPQISSGFLVERLAPQNPGSSGRSRIRPANITVHLIGSVDPDVPPLPPTRRISPNLVRQYSMSRNTDGTWSHSSKVMFESKAIREGE
ncbi:RHS repeat-associated core domain-containing protein [Pseudomonas izuensis]|uniref:RHS repeat-associated core domain-containing protein n=1 Tax=Pseudomonas izuensis TaxID=2684212 RepID=UPI000BBA5340|nr:RHS repeat-associated core domain-containing protein [Pseudomonas izuensis]